MIHICPHCGQQMEEDGNLCLHCGLLKELPPATLGPNKLETGCVLAGCVLPVVAVGTSALFVAGGISRVPNDPSGSLGFLVFGVLMFLFAGLIYWSLMTMRSGNP